jgi:hypothetical protein
MRRSRTQAKAFRSSAQNQNGTAALESTFAISILVPIVISGFAVIYFSFARVWLDRSSYEALICLSTESSQQDCEKNFRRQVDGALPIGTLSNVRLTRTRQHAEIDMRFAVADQNVIHLHISQTLPLKTRTPI